jgi:hypothetical protein
MAFITGRTASRFVSHSCSFISARNEAHLNLGIRNFIVGVVVKVASEETIQKKEKAYLNKLNLALVQVSTPDHLLCRFGSNTSADPQARMAAQLADLYS